MRKMTKVLLEFKDPPKKSDIDDITKCIKESIANIKKGKPPSVKATKMDDMECETDIDRNEVMLYFIVDFWDLWTCNK